MSYSLLADVTMLAHGMFVLFVVFGGLAVLRWPRLAWLHLPSAIWGVVIEFKGWICPLTHLENRFRRLAGEAGNGGSFVEHCLEPLLYPLGLTTRSQVMMGLTVLGINAVLYACLWWKLFARPERLKKS